MILGNSDCGVDVEMTNGLQLALSQ